MQISIFVSNYRCHQAYDSPQAQVATWPFLDMRWAQLATWQRHTQPTVRLAFGRIFNTVLNDTKCLISVLQHQALGVAQLDTLMLSPVHLAMQRDSFYLQEAVAVTASEYVSLTELLATHFADDFDLLTTDCQQAWWVKPKRRLDLRLPWLGDYIDANAHAWNQQGVTDGSDASVIRKWSNEIQMLLHTHTINQERERNHQVAINSMWFSQASPLPNVASHFDAIMGQGEVFEGLCASGMRNCVPSQLTLATLKTLQGHLALVYDNVNAVDWALVEQQLEQGKVKKIEVMLPWGHHSVSASYHRWQRFNPLRRPQSPLQRLGFSQA